MPALKYESFRSRRFEVIVNKLYGVHLIRNRATDQTTLLATCCEGFEEYRRLKATWRKSRQCFDKLCAEETYYQ